MASLWEALLGQQPQPSPEPAQPNRLSELLMSQSLMPMPQVGMEHGVRSRLPGADIPAMMGEALQTAAPYTGFGQPPSLMSGVGYAMGAMGAGGRVPSLRPLNAHITPDAPARGFDPAASGRVSDMRRQMGIAARDETGRATDEAISAIDAVLRTIPPQYR